MIPADAVPYALTNAFPHLWPEIILGVFACVLYLAGTWKRCRHTSALVALLGLLLAGAALVYGPSSMHERSSYARAVIYSGPVLFDHLTLLIRVVAFVGAAVLVLFSWDEVGDDQAADYFACMLVLTAGMSLTAAANDLVTLFLALELVSIPTYIMLYLPRTGAESQEAAMKYFLLSVFSSAFLLFGFSYLYGLTGTTNIPLIHDALAATRDGGTPGLALVALVMVVAALGFKITAVPFHFYAPDVYQGSATCMGATLAFVPKVAGFAALLRLLGLVPIVLATADGPVTAGPNILLGAQTPVLLWIMAAVTMSLGNVLGLLQDNIKRMLAYSSVAHAGYMLIGLAVAPKLAEATGSPAIGVEAVLFYLVSYGSMTIGAFAVLAYLSTPERRIETVDDLAGLAKSRPGLALVMVLFLMSLLGMPLTAGFAGKVLLFFSALGIPAPTPEQLKNLSPERVAQMGEQARLFRILALIGVVNSAIGGWYYLRIAAAMFLREPLRPISRPGAWPVLGSIVACAFFTLGFGIWQEPLVKASRQAASPPIQARTVEPPTDVAGPTEVATALSP